MLKKLFKLNFRKFFYFRKYFLHKDNKYIYLLFKFKKLRSRVINILSLFYFLYTSTQR